MTIHHLRKVLHHLHRVLDATGASSLTDGQLLARFVASRDETAFAALMRRHGPMVLGVCRRILRHAQDAEDAFQAVFLVLARKAGSVVHRPALGSWLYRVAYRLALDAKARNDKRRVHERQVDELPHPPVPPAETGDWRMWLDHELNLLPERYRAVVVACDLEERSRKEAARLLGLAEGTVSSRLARGRSLLAKRLSRYGLSLSAATWTAAWLHEAPAAVPLALTSATMLATSGKGTVAASVGFLTKGALQAMFLTKLKWTVGAVLVVAALGATGLVYRATGQAPSAQSTSTPATKEAGGKQPTELEILRREIELLKLKMEVVQEKQRAQEAELRALRTATKEPATQVRSETWGYRFTTPTPPQWEIGKIKMDGKLQWPKPLQKSEFKEVRDRVDALTLEVYKNALSGNTPNGAVFSDLVTTLQKMEIALAANADHLSSADHTEAESYLHIVKDTITNLTDSNMANFFNVMRMRKGVSSEREPVGRGQPNVQQETDLKKKEEILRSEVEMRKERAAWSERMARPGRQFVTPAQADADQARLQSARLLLRQLETQLRLREAEKVLKELHEARNPEAQQRAADRLEKVLRQLREHIDKEESAPQGSR